MPRSKKRGALNTALWNLPKLVLTTAVVLPATAAAADPPKDDAVEDQNTTLDDLRKLYDTGYFAPYEWEELTVIWQGYDDPWEWVWEVFFGYGNCPNCDP